MTVPGLELPDWGRMFVPDQSLLESFLRGTAVYFSALVLMRIIPRRQVGSVGLTDILLLVLLSESVSQALTAKSSSVPNAMAAMAALMFWNFALDWAAHRWEWVRAVLEPKPVVLIRGGRVLRENLDQQEITWEELLSQLRQNGVTDPSAVRLAVMEGGGGVSVIPTDAPKGDDPAPDSPPDFGVVLARFQAAAGDLQAAVAWHDRQATEHTAQAKAARQALARFGVRVPRPRPAGSEREMHMMNGRPPVPAKAGDLNRPEE